MKLTIESTLSCATCATIELPVNNWEEIKEFFVKWDTLHYTLDGENWLEIELNSVNDYDIIDWKRPLSVCVLNDEYEKLSEYS